jgi:PAS domain S-box-containing protein
MGSKNISQFSSFKIVFFYAVFSALYIYTSDYFLAAVVPDIGLLTKLQTLKGLVFILFTSLFLYVLVKKNIDKAIAHYQHVIDLQQQSDEQVQKSQEAYLSLFNQSPLPMVLFDNETLRFLLVNDAACTNYGYTREEYATMTLKDIRPIEDIPVLEKNIALSSKSGIMSYDDIIRHRKKNGEIIQVKIKTTFVTFEGKQVRLALPFDITEEMDIQSKLIASNARFQVASEIAGLGYWTHDLITHDIQWSEELYKIYEVDPLRFPLTIESIKSCFHPEDRNYINPKVLNDLEDIPIKENENRIITPDGKVKWIFERIFVAKNNEGKVTKLDGVTLDITKRKLHEQELQESEERFKILAKATAEAIIDWDIKNDKVVWGDGFQTLFGYDLEVYDNYLWSKNIHPEDRDQVLDDLNTTIEDPTKQYFIAQFRFLKANRDIAFVQHKGVFIRDSKGVAIRAYAAMVDLTESLERMNQIELQDKALKDISWTQSHVVRAPLANLLGFIYLLEENIETGLSDKEIIDHIGASAKRLDEIIRDIVSKTN